MFYRYRIIHGYAQVLSVIEMKKELIFIIALTITAVLGGLGTVYAHSGEVSEKYEKAVNPVKVTPESLEAGKNIYTQRCAVCHGADGKGTAAGMPDFTDHEMMEEMSESLMFQKVSEGVPGTPMPAWKDILSEDERWTVINYINSMHHGGETHADEASHAAEAQSKEQSFAAAPEKGVCGPTALLLLAALPAMFQAFRRRR